MRCLFGKNTSVAEESYFFLLYDYSLSYGSFSEGFHLPFGTGCAIDCGTPFVIHKAFYHDKRLNIDSIFECIQNMVIALSL